jgi:hypothetical protein
MAFRRSRVRSASAPPINQALSRPAVFFRPWLCLILCPAKSKIATSLLFATGVAERWIRKAGRRRALRESKPETDPSHLLQEHAPRLRSADVSSRPSQHLGN